MLVPKDGASVSYERLGLAHVVVLGSDSGLVVRSRNGIESM